MILLCRNFICI